LIIRTCSFLFKIKTKLRDWAIHYAESKDAKRWLAFFSFAEAIFFPVPADIILIAILTSRQSHKWVYYSFITFWWSVLGGIFGYIIGFFLFDTVGSFLVSTYGLEVYLEQIQEMFNKNAFWAIFIGGFTPIPYKIFTLSAGFFSVNFVVFIVASLLSRLMRFFAVGYIMKVFGAEIGKFVFKYFNFLTYVLAIIVVAFMLFATFGE